MYPNHDPKPVGAYVRNVHPCGHRDDAGVVIQVSGCHEEGDTLTVATGIGGTTYGPACNWEPTDHRPGWLDELEYRRAAGRQFVGAECTLNGSPATISGRLNRFATVAALPDGPTASFSWEAVYRVMTWPNDTAGRFHS